MFIKQWNDLAISNGLKKGLYFVAHTSRFSEYKELIDLGFDSITVNPISRVIINLLEPQSKTIRRMLKLWRFIFRNSESKVVEYNKALEFFINKNEDSIENVIPTIIPNWDHSPRSGKNGCILHNSKPILFQKNVRDALDCIKSKSNEHKIIFLKSWNEWEKVIIWSLI